MQAKNKTPATFLKIYSTTTWHEHPRNQILLDGCKSSYKDRLSSSSKNQFTAKRVSTKRCSDKLQQVLKVLGKHLNFNKIEFNPITMLFDSFKVLWSGYLRFVRCRFWFVGDRSSFLLGKHFVGVQDAWKTTSTHISKMSWRHTLKTTSSRRFRDQEMFAGILVSK